jgi:NADH dehydrogenase [ubiquinone] 1 alpha subcomplex assembly factor 5
MIDSSSRMLDQIRPPVEDGVEIIKKHMDEEELTGDESSYDLAYSCLSLHWINDLPGVFRRVLYLLKNDAPFIGKERFEYLTLIEWLSYVFRCHICFRYFI